MEKIKGLMSNERTSPICVKWIPHTVPPCVKGGIKGGIVRIADVGGAFRITGCFGSDKQSLSQFHCQLPLHKGACDAEIKPVRRVARNKRSDWQVDK